MEFLINNAYTLNWWAVIVASLAVFPVGYLWYDIKLGYGKRWAKLIGLSVKDLQKSDGMAKTFASLAALSLVTTIVLGCLLKATSTTGFIDSVAFGFILGVVLRGGAHLVHNGFARRPDELTLIDATHDTLALMVVCGILGVWV